MKTVFRVVRGLRGQAIPGPLDQLSIVAGWLRNLQFHIVHHPVTYARSSLEGRRYWDKQEKIERNSSLGREAKRLNAEQNGGWIECEACGFRDKDTSMLDAHHLVPLSAGPGQNCAKDFAVLCPTCHRWWHTKRRATSFTLCLSRKFAVRDDLARGSNQSQAARRTVAARSTGSRGCRFCNP